MSDQLRFVIVGHVDHGKSTLIGRLFYDTDSLPEEKVEEVRRACEEMGREMEFGFVMDHLEEERVQGITIDTAQTFFNTGKRRYVIIDAPGHREFLKNMITGASQADAALLIVDAREGVKEQTRRHAYILKMLGIGQVMVLINKMDLVGYSEARFDEVRGELMLFLSPLGISPSRSIPISARDGDNVAIPSDKMPWYHGPTVLEGLDSFAPRKAASGLPLRFPIQDVYKVRDKRILVGRVESGKICRGDEVVFLPQGSRTRVSSIEVLWKDCAEAEAGQSIGITVADPLFVERGAVACLTGDLPTITSGLRASLFWMSRQPFRIDQDLTIRIATQEVPASLRIEGKIDSSSMAPIVNNPDSVLETEIAQVTINTRQPVVVEDFNDIQELGRFVLIKDLDVVAGGIVSSSSQA